MKATYSILAFIAAAVLIAAAPESAPAVKLATPEVVAYFAPTLEIEKRLVNEINSETTWIRVQAYALTHTDILDALIDAKGRGVDVQIICDDRWAKSSAKSFAPVAAACATAKIPLMFDGKHPIAHAKFIVFASRPLVEVGSYNFTNQARHNHEDALFITDQNIHDQFLIDWNNHASHCKPAP